MSDDEYFGRSADHLELLARELNELRGNTSLIFELTQNADDAPDATWIRYSVEEDALYVRNNGVFTDCGDVGAPECPWRDEDRAACDFHSFRSVSGARKREREGTTGTFGVGFTAVYQITDAPELLSAGRHWILDETQPTEKRIRQCKGCDRCRAAAPGTEFRLPWAREKSLLRSHLRSGFVDRGMIERLALDLAETLPHAVLFLRRLVRLEMDSEATGAVAVERTEPERGVFVLQYDDAVSEWLRYDGSFDSEADALCRLHSSELDAKHRSEVSVVIRVDEPVDGRMYAFLPTEQPTGCEAHIQADFYPLTDRKRLVSEGPKGDWNRLAVQRAGDVIAEALDSNVGTTSSLVESIGHGRVWRLIASVRASGSGTSANSPWSKLLWEAIAGRLRSAVIMPTVGGMTVEVAGTILLKDAGEHDNAAVLTKLGFKVVSRDVDPVVRSLQYSEFGVAELTLSRLLDALQFHEFSEAVPASLDHDDRGQLCDEIDVLVARSSNLEERKRLDTMRLLFADDGTDVAVTESWLPDPEAVALFGPVCLGRRFLDPGLEIPEYARDRVPGLGVSDAVEVLTTGRSDDLDVVGVIRWIASRPEDELTTEAVWRLRVLPIWPSGDGSAHPLDDLVLPGGDFDAPVGVAGLVDMEALSGCRQLLQRLGCEPLTLERFVRDFLAQSDDGFVRRNTPKWFEVVRQLARNHSKLQDIDGIREVMVEIPLVLSADHGGSLEFRRVGEVYRASTKLDELIGTGYYQARPISDVEKASNALYDWLGLRTEPAYRDVAAEVTRRAAVGRSEEYVRYAIEVLRHLHERTGDPELGDLKELKALSWLPGSRSQTDLFRPADLARSNQKLVFETQANFLDIGVGVENSLAATVDRLGLFGPNQELVAAHLLHLVSAGQPPAGIGQIYRFLVGAPGTVTARLRSVPCVWIPNHRWVRPESVFRSSHRFGRYRQVLPTEYTEFVRFFEAVGVRPEPSFGDAVGVLADVAEESDGQPLTDDQRQAVVACWGFIDDLRVRGVVGAEQLRVLWGARTVPAATGELRAPNELFVNDLPDVAEKLGSSMRERLIALPERVGPSMRAAGLRLLSEVVRLELVEHDGLPADTELAEHLLEFAQVMVRAAQSAEGDVRERYLKFVTETDFRVTSSLTVQYVLSDLGLCSSPISRAAGFAVERGAFYSTEDRGWRIVATELARAMFPAHPEIGLGWASIIGCRSKEEAELALDELGVPRLADEFNRDVPLVEAADVAAVESDESSVESEAPEANGIEDVPPTPGAPDAQPNIRPRSAVEDAREVSSPAAPKSQPQTSSDDALQHQGAARQGAHGSTSRRVIHETTRLRSYVVPERETDEPVDSARAAARMTTSRAAVEVVLQHELAAKRVPTEMEHLNPGYDIESRDSSGEIVRYIEVKGLKGDWAGDAEVSRTQFWKARELGDRFWLYIVERATSAPRLHRIQNPANRVDAFVFDDGWSEVEERDE